MKSGANVRLIVGDEGAWDLCCYCIHRLPAFFLPLAPDTLVTSTLTVQTIDVQSSTHVEQLQGKVCRVSGSRLGSRKPIHGGGQLLTAGRLLLVNYPTVFQ